LSLYLDTSVLIPYYSPEPLSARCEALIRSETRPVISDLCAVELVSALARKVRRMELEAAEAERIKSAFQSHVEGSYYTLVPLERRHFRLAQDWIGQFRAPLRSLDGLHLAVVAAAGISIATADLALASSAEAFGIEVARVG
jgi:predicted nucleic acid-binding protein